MQKRRYIILVFYFILLTPLWMYLLWHLNPPREMKIAIIDKTVLTKKGQEHRSLNWVLNYKKYVRPDGKLYSIPDDYYGFFPLDKEKYKKQGFENMTKPQLDKIPDKYDMAYFTDTYGMYYNEWFKIGRATERSPHIFGGMQPEDIQVIREMKKRKKLVICEFNTICSPTAYGVRSQFENMYGMKWSGWIGRYFECLDTTINKELPLWVVRNYKRQHGNKWPFKKAGMVFDREDDHVEVLEINTHLEKESPCIITNKDDQARYNVPEKVGYPYWFDIMLTTHRNHVVSVFEIYPNKHGDSILQAYHIPTHFPAMMEHYDSAYKFFYFSGDFADNPIKDYLAQMKGIWYLSPLFYTRDDLTSRTGFFWEYYAPVMSTILNRYYHDMNTEGPLGIIRKLQKST